jgi:hypothetical protein
MREAFWIELARDDRLRKSSDIRRLLSRKPRAVQRRVVETRDLLGTHATGDLLQPLVGGSSGRERDLLLEDDLHQGLESRRPVPERRRAVARDDTGEMPVPAGELGDAFRERVGRQLERHVHLTSQPTAL